MTAQLNTTLKIKMLKVALELNCANTALLYVIDNMVTKKRSIIFGKVDKLLISSIIAATEPMQLWPIIPREA